MTVIVAVIVGFLSGRMLWLALRKTWQRQVFLRKNFHGITLPTAAGIVLPLALILVEAIRSVAFGVGIGEESALNPPRIAALIAITGFAMLGLLDDLTGGAEARGFAGHIRALFKGQLTSGSVKMFGGVALALVASSLMLDEPNAVALLIDGAIIALAANLLNLFDLRPGRATKVGLIGFAVIAGISLLDTALVPVAIVVGAAAALVLDDLRERLMLGDTGANAMGAALGLGIVTQVGDTGRVIALIVLLGLNLASEFVSFSKLIDSVAPLRALDMMGRRNDASIDVREASDGDPNGGSNGPSARVNVGGAPEVRSTPVPAGFSSRAGTPARDDDDRPFTRNHAPGNPDYGTGAPETDRWQ